MVIIGRSSRSFLAAAAVVGSGVLVAGCGGSSHSDYSHGEVSIAKAADLSTSAAGYKVSLTEHATAAGHTINVTGTGVWDAKDRAASIQANVSVDGQTVPMQMVFADDTIYEHLPAEYTSQIPDAEPWLSINLNQAAKLAKLPSMSSLLDSGSSGAGNPSQYLEYLKAAGKSVQNLGQETIGGVQTTHYRASLSLSELPDTVPASQRAAAQQLVTELQNKYKASYSPVDVWVDQAGLVRQIQMSLSETVDGHAIAMTITEQFTSYGPQTAPTIPSAGETTNLVSLLKVGLG